MVYGFVIEPGGAVGWTRPDSVPLMETKQCGTPPTPDDVLKRKGARAGWKGGREPKLLVELADARAVVPRAQNDYVHGASGVAH